MLHIIGTYNGQLGHFWISRCKQCL